MPEATLEDLQAFENALEENADKYRALINKAQQEFASLLPRFDDMLNLKETVRAQAAEIERLNKENSDLLRQLTAANIERNEALYAAQQAQLTVAAFQNKNAKLLEIVRMLKFNGGRTDNLFVASFELPHSASKKATIGMLGRMEMVKNDRLHSADRATANCTNCRGGIPQPGSAASSFTDGCDDDAFSGEPVDANSGLPEDMRNAPYEARITALAAERDGLMELYTARIAELQASFERVRATLSERAEKAENELANASKELVQTIRKAGDLEVRVLHLESNLASQAAKGTISANRMREEAEQAIRDARRELKILTLNKQKEVKTVEKKAKQAVTFDHTKFKERINELETLNEQLKNEVVLTKDRLQRCERKLREVTDENALVRESLRNIHSSVPSLALTGITRSSVTHPSSYSGPSMDLLSVCSGGEDWVTVYDAYTSSSGNSGTSGSRSQSYKSIQK